ncbi:MAG: hypothetical protein AB8B50_19320 [Pirellulaceae bacterium]
MNCTETQKLLVEHCLGETSDGASRDIEAHLQEGCTECLEQFREVQGATDAFFASVPSNGIDDRRHQDWIEQTLARCRTYGSTSPNSLFHEVVARPVSTVAHTAREHRVGNSRQNSVGVPLARITAFVASLAAGVLCAAYLPSLADSVKVQENVADADFEFPLVGNEGFDLGSLPPAALPSEHASRLQASARSEPVFVSRGSSEPTKGGSLVILRDNVAHQLHIFGRGFVTGKKGSSFELHIRLATDSLAHPLCPIVADSDGSFECVVDFSGGRIAEAFLVRPDR